MAWVENTERRRIALIPVFVTDDTFLVLGSAVALVLCMLAGEPQGVFGVVRLALGLGFVLFAPGYCLTTGMFPRRDDLDPPTRLGLSIGLSITLVPLLTLILNWLPWGIYPWPILIAELATCAASLLFTIWLRARLPAEERYEPTLRRLAWQTVLTWGFIASALVILIYGMTAPMRATAPTEFYVLGANGLATDYPRKVRAGETVTVTSSILSREPAERTFRVEVWLVDSADPSNSTLLNVSDPITLQPNQAYTQEQSWRHVVPGDNQLVDLHLLVEGKSLVFRRLHLWIDVSL